MGYGGVADATLEAIAQGIADDLPVGVWAARAPSGELLYANKMFVEIMGMNALSDQSAGTLSVSYALHDREGVRYPEERLPFTRAIAERRTITCDDIVSHRRDGSCVNIRAQAKPVLDEAGVVTHVVVAFIDITREIEAERARDAFLSVAAHELRTPIATLQLRMHHLYALIARGEAPSAEKLLCWLTGSDRQVRRLARLSDQLLDLSRIEDARFTPELEEGDLSAAAFAAVHAFEELSGGAPSPIFVHTCGPLRMRFDPQRVEYVLTNLVSNAVKYGEGRPVTVSVHREGDAACISVSDEGIGVSPIDHARIFEPFERAVSPRNYGGLGLGLWIARHYVESMGGHIRLESDVGAGATFTVDLPCNP